MSRRKKKKISRNAQTTSDLAAIKDFALQQYIERCGENLKKIADAIYEKFHFRITREKLKSWCDEGKWEDILSGSREQATTMKPGETSFKRAMFEAFKDRKVAYEKYFKTIEDGKMDNNAHWAYKDILTKLDSLQEEMEQEKALSQAEKHQKDGESMGELFGFDY